MSEHKLKKSQKIRELGPAGSGSEAAFSSAIVALVTGFYVTRQNQTPLTTMVAIFKGKILYSRGFQHLHDQRGLYLCALLCAARATLMSVTLMSAQYFYIQLDQPWLLHARLERVASIK